MTASKLPKAGEQWPAVSVILPAYNAAWCIRDALDSLAAQTFSDFEVVVVDDGSTDDTQAAVVDYVASAALPTTRLISQDNRGLGAARNAGIRGSTGEFVAFLDADDVWSPERLKRVIETFASLPETFGLVCHDELTTRDGTALRTERYGPWVEPMYEQLLFHGSCLSPSASTVRRSVLDRTGAFSENPSFHSIEDYDLWLRMSRRTRFFFLHETLGEYRLHDASLSSMLKYNVRNELSVLDTHFENAYGRKWIGPGLRVRIRKRRQLVHRRAARKYLERDDRVAAFRSLRTALRLYPFAPKAWALLAVLAVNGRRWLVPAGVSLGRGAGAR